MNEAFYSPFFGIIICIFSFQIGVYINKKTGSPLANPLLIANTIIIGSLKVFNIPFESFYQGGKVIALFLAPVTACLAISIYKQLDILKESFIPIVCGCAVGSLFSMGSIYILCKLFKLDEKLTASLIPKSVTTPIALGIAEQHGGIAPVTMTAVVITGILGAILAPLMIKIFKINNSVAAGIAIGSSSHALGTSKAVEIGEIEGAMSSIAIGVSGIITVLFAMFL